MLNKLGNMIPSLHSWLPPELGSQPGFLPAKLEENVRRFMSEVNMIFASVKAHMEEKILRERDKRVLKFIDMKSREDPDEEQVGQISAMETKLKHLGLGEMSSEDLLMEALEDDAGKGPEDYLEAESDMQYNYD